MGLKPQFNPSTRGEKAMMERTLEILLLGLLSILAVYGAEEEDGGCFGDKLEPKEAFLSSTYKSQHGIEFEAKFCIDGKDDGPEDTKGVTEPDMCHGGTRGTGGEKAPWFAIDYGDEGKVAVGKVVIVNRKVAGKRAKLIKVRVSDELPTSGEELFTGGTLLAEWEGPGKDHEKIEIKSDDGKEGTIGRYLIIQMDKTGGRGWLNLKEVTAFGKKFVSACAEAE